MTKEMFLVRVDDEETLVCKLTSDGWQWLDDGNGAADSTWSKWTVAETPEDILKYIFEE